MQLFTASPLFLAISSLHSPIVVFQVGFADTDEGGGTHEGDGAHVKFDIPHNHHHTVTSQNSKMSDTIGPGDTYYGTQKTYGYVVKVACHPLLTNQKWLSVKIVNLVFYPMWMKFGIGTNLGLTVVLYW